MTYIERYLHTCIYIHREKSAAISLNHFFPYRSPPNGPLRRECIYIHREKSAATSLNHLFPYRSPPNGPLHRECGVRSHLAKPLADPPPPSFFPPCESSRQLRRRCIEKAVSEATSLNHLFPYRSPPNGLLQREGGVRSHLTKPLTDSPPLFFFCRCGAQGS
jgi:hypothetical protein